MINRIAVLATVMILSAPARADLILILDDGLGNSVSITDGSVLDTNPLAGVVSFSGGLGAFIVNVSTGISYPVMGSPLEPILHLNSVEVSVGTGSIMIGLSATDFIAPFGDGSFALAFGGVTGGTIDVEAYVDSTNAAWGTQTLLGSLSSGTGGAFSSSLSGAVNIAASPYSMSLFTTITHTSTAVSSFDADLRIPEPATLGIFGLGLLLLGFSRKRTPIQARK